jgi:RNA polymerase sigma-70 factor (ECF subfamily)
MTREAPVDERSIQIVRDALRGDRVALKRLVDELTPVVQSRVARGLLRRASGERRSLRQEVEDMTQDVFCMLFAHEARVLRAWVPERGASLPNFVGLVASRHVASTLRNGRRDPWRDSPAEFDELETLTEATFDTTPQIDSRRALTQLLERMRDALSPRGLELFHRLYVEEEPLDEVCDAMGMTREAVYAWKNRVSKLLKRIAREFDEGSFDVGTSSQTKMGSSDER